MANGVILELDCDATDCVHNLNGKCIMAAAGMAMMLNEDGTCADYSES